MEIQIDSQGLSNIYNAGQLVTLVRLVDQSVGSDLVAASSLSVAWQAFAPMQNNTVTWASDFYCFATTTPLVMNAVIEMNTQSAVPIRPGYVYAFTQGVFVQQKMSQSPKSYVVANAMPAGSYAFGLAQAAVVNNVSILAPVCVVPVLYNETAYFNPTAVIATFLSTENAPGTLLPEPSNAFEIAVASGSGRPMLGFNDQTNLFYELSGSAS
ncbi:MAG TPA: hypothetical protein VGF53_18145 [Pseudolabrys sp.]